MKFSPTKLLLGVLAAVFLSGAAIAGDADFTLVNRTGYAIREVYISPSHKEKWGNDRLGRSVLDNSSSRKFTFSDSSACLQDLMVVFDDDDSKVTWEEFDLCELNKITLKYNRKTGDVSADTE
jgi:hypothetical protein